MVDGLLSICRCTSFQGVIGGRRECRATAVFHSVTSCGCGSGTLHLPRLWPSSHGVQRNEVQLAGQRLVVSGADCLGVLRSSTESAESANMSVERTSLSTSVKNFPVTRTAVTQPRRKWTGILKDDNKLPILGLEENHRNLCSLYSRHWNDDIDHSATGDNEYGGAGGV